MSAAAITEPVIVGSVLVGADEFVATYVASRIPHMHGKSFGECRALGVVKKGMFVGGVVYHNYNVHDIQVSIAIDKPCLMPWRALFSYPFDQGCVRLTAIVGRKNKRSRKMVAKLGFTLEGVHLKGLDGIEDAFSFGLLKENCRWIKERTNGQV